MAAKTHRKLTTLPLAFGMLFSPACQLPPDQEGLDDETVVETEESELQQALPPTGVKVPTILKVDRMGAISGTCRNNGDQVVAEIRYRATRGRRTDSVLLTLASKNGIFSLTHTRNGQDLGTQRIDGVTQTEVGTGGFSKLGRERHTANLLAEMVSSGFLKKLPDALNCLGKAPAGQMSRDGQTYLSYGWCNFAWDATDFLFQVTATVVEVACCAAAVAGCPECIIGIEVIKQTASKASDVGEAVDCGSEEERERREMQEQIKELQEQVKEMKRKQLEEEEKKQAEELERAMMGT